MIQIYNIPLFVKIQSLILVLLVLSSCSTNKNIFEEKLENNFFLYKLSNKSFDVKVNNEVIGCLLRGEDK